MVALMKLYPQTSAFCLCPYPAVGSGGGDDDGGVCRAPGLLILSMTEPVQASPGQIP